MKSLLMNCKKYLSKSTFFFLLFTGALFPSSRLHAAVQLTEIAWMGIAGANGQYGEWMELYNDGEESPSLAGWTIRADDDVIFTLTKTIAPHSYLLVERVTPSMPDPLPSFSDEAGSFGSGGLSNEGENLTLRNAVGDIVQTLSYAASGWPAGNGANKDTMQWRSGSWITAAATPGAPAPAGSSSSGGGGSSSISSTTPKPAPITYEPRLAVTIPSELYQYVEYEFVADLMLEDGKYHTKGPFRWNFGDGTSVVQEKLAPLVHAYRYPGTYTLWLGYYETVFDKKPTIEFSKTVKIGTPSLSVSIVDREAVEITNLSGKVVDLSGWKLFSGGVSATLPEYTLVAPDASIILSAQTLGFSALPDISLTRPTGERVVTTTGKATAATANAVRSSVSVAAPVAPALSPTSAVPIADFFAADTTAVGEQKSPTEHRTRITVFFAILIVTVALCVLLERAMLRREAGQ